MKRWSVKYIYEIISYAENPNDALKEAKATIENDGIEKYFLDYSILEDKLLSEEERTIIANFDPKFKWIVRNCDGSLWVSEEKPEKGEMSWKVEGSLIDLSVYNHLFKVIEWSGESIEPTLIESLWG